MLLNQITNKTNPGFIKFSQKVAISEKTAKGI